MNAMYFQKQSDKLNLHGNISVHGGTVMNGAILRKAIVILSSAVLLAAAGCSSGKAVTRALPEDSGSQVQEIIDMGYEPCKTCHP